MIIFSIAQYTPYIILQYPCTASIYAAAYHCDRSETRQCLVSPQFQGFPTSMGHASISPTAQLHNSPFAHLILFQHGPVGYSRVRGCISASISTITVTDTNTDSPIIIAIAIAIASPRMNPPSTHRPPALIFSFTSSIAVPQSFITTLSLHPMLPNPPIHHG